MDMPPSANKFWKLLANNCNENKNENPLLVFQNTAGYRTE